MDKKLYLTLILVRTIYSGVQILVKAALAAGMSPFVINFYVQAMATIFLAPIAIISERKRAPPLSLKLLFKMFMLALCGATLTTELYYVALDYTTATLAAATTNTIPVITFILAVLLRMEAVKLSSHVGIAKILGVAFCLAGVMVIAFYQGPPLKSLNHHPLLLLPGPGHQTSAAGNSGSSSSKTWVKGCFIMLLANIGWSLWLVLQYPSKLLFTTFVCLFSTIQTLFTGLIFERDFSRWKLGLDVGLLSVAYCGIVGTGVSFYLQSWCIERAGPVVPAMWAPLTLLITISCSSLIFGETVSAGSVIGGLLMVGGLYCVLWGKSEEQADGGRLPTSREDGKEKLRMKQMPSPLDEAAKESNLDSSDSKCRVDEKN